MLTSEAHPFNLQPMSMVSSLESHPASQKHYTLYGWITVVRHQHGSDQNGIVLRDRNGSNCPHGRQSSANQSDMARHASVRSKLFQNTGKALLQ